jgi:carbon-monoxide dehydrogenase large subunit
MSASATGYIGRAVPRIEDARLLRGLGRYIDDVPEPPGTLHAAFLRSPHAHARVGRSDTVRAASLPGVYAVAAAADVEGLFTPLRADYDRPGFNCTNWYSIATDRVRYAGEIVAVVLAESRYVAEDALELIDVAYDPLPVIATVDQALADGATKLHDDIAANVLFTGSFKAPGFDEAFAAADVTVAETFTSARVTSAAMETRGGLAIIDAGRGDLIYYATTQQPHIWRTALSEAFGWPENRIRVIAPDIGGGFGPKAYLYPEDVLAVALARKFERPVKWNCDRIEELQTTVHARDHRFAGELAISREGTIRALRVKIAVNAGAYAGFPFGSSIEAAGGALMMPGPYRLKHYAFETRAIATNLCPAGAYRGVSQPTAFFVMEGLLDRAAAKLGLDPAEIRRRNLIAPNEFPYTNAMGIRYDIGRYGACFERALELSDYAAVRSRPRGPGADGKLRGIGIGCFTEHTGQGATRYRERGIRRMPGYDSAQIKVVQGGKANVFVSQTEIGQGSLTTCAQIVADRIGIRIEDIVVYEGDTELTPHGSGTAASRGAVAAGGAVLRAADKVRDKIVRIAADVLEASPSDIELRDGAAHVVGAPKLKVSLVDIADIAHAAHDRSPPPGESFGLEATDYYDPPHVYITNATHVANVAVDPATGRIEIERYIVVHDCGRVINPLVVEGQIHGGVVQGLGQALVERVVHGSDGQLLTAHFLDYLLPTALDVPDIEIAHFETPSPETAGGFKGVGEGGVIGALPALANAVGDALSHLGVRPKRLPLSPDAVLDLIEQAATGSKGDA